MERVLLILPLASLLLSCGNPVGSFDCDVEPLPSPAFDIEGADIPDSGHLQLRGQVAGIVLEGGRLEITIGDDPAGQALLGLILPPSVLVDLVVGADIEVDYWQRQGFEGTARGVRIRDGSGTILIAEDGGYGNAILGEDLAPFTVAQTDAGCRNRGNRPGDLNNFKLAASADDESLELIHGERGTLRTTSGEYAVVALRSVAGVGDVFWTDAPYDSTSYVIARMP